MEPPFASLEARQAGAGPAATVQPLLSLRGINKRFPLVLANDNVNLDIYEGEIHALLGENGAGKSTLMKIMYGFYNADSGAVLLEGHPVRIGSPSDARKLGIGMLFQDFSLIPALTVAENIALFLDDVGFVVNLNQVTRRIDECGQRYGLAVPAGAKVADLSLGETQKAEILKLLISGARILILDEPTRVLAPHEVASLFRVLRSLCAGGYAIILISHKIKEVLDCADRITVLRGGRVSGLVLRAEADERILVELMFGKEMPRLARGTQSVAREVVAPVLQLHGVTTRADGANTPLRDLDLSIYPGDIVGVAGVSGNGQKELGDLVLGMISCAEGEKLLFGRPAARTSIREARRQGLAFIPENPLAMASVPFMTVLQNMALTRPWRYARLGGLAVDWARVKGDVQAGMQKLGGNLALHAVARTLSGGNLQRMVIIRELGLDPRLIVASYPTRGLDVQTALAARQALLDARREGAGVLLISEDLEELFLLSDRLIVLYEGRIVATLKPSETDYQQVGYLMTGSRGDHGAGG